MHDQQIYELMAKTPKIRAVQISDALDEDLADVSATLRALVEAGDVVQGKGFAPNGAQSMVYDLSDAFKSSPAYAEIARKLESLPAPPATPDRSVAPDERPMGTEVSRVERALQAVLINGLVSEVDMRATMGLRKGEYPSSYLAASIKAGKLHKRGVFWYYGPAGAPQVAAQAVAPAADIAPSRHGGPGAVIRAYPDTDSRPNPSATEPASTLRCALWSDGLVELQSDGKTVATLTHAESEFMAAFIGRVGRAFPDAFFNVPPPGHQRRPVEQQKN